jgi:cytosine/adenosine deaminase-related metal-dependent hydrolase
MTPEPVTFVNARIDAQPRASLRLDHGRVAAIGAAPVAGDAVADAGGDRILPGLINAHDHLQLNNFPRLKYRERHDNVAEWIADIDARRISDHAIAEPAALRRELRLLIGGLKNILSGATTVAHHDPFYPSLDAAGFPCRVLADYGWAHSLGLEGDEQVRASYRATSASTPWFIHAGEGIDAAASGEFARLERLGCIGANTRLIHGVAFTAAERERLAACGAGLIWCPSSNFHLFGVTADCGDAIARRCVALGSDSRLSADGDLLDELRAARERCGVAEADLEAMVTTVGARLLGLADRGTLAPGALADCIVLPRGLPLGEARRADLRCVMLGGIMMCGDADYARALMAPERRVAATVDGRAKVLDRRLAELLRSAPLHDQGVQLAVRRGRAA